MGAACSSADGHVVKEGGEIKLTPAFARCCASDRVASIGGEREFVTSLYGESDDPSTSPVDREPYTAAAVNFPEEGIAAELVDSDSDDDPGFVEAEHWQAMLKTAGEIALAAEFQPSEPELELGQPLFEGVADSAAAASDPRQDSGMPSEHDDAHVADPEDPAIDAAFEAIRDGRTLASLPEAARCNKEVVLAAILNEGAFCFDSIGRDLRARDRDVAMALLDDDGSVLELLGEELRADRQVVMRALRNSAGALKAASPELQADKVVQEAAAARAKEEKRLFKAYAYKCAPVPCVRPVGCTPSLVSRGPR